MKTWLMVIALIISAPVLAEESQLSANVVDLKQSVLQLNRDLYQLEEDLLSLLVQQ